MSFYTVTEPHPTVPQNSYTHSGRGGAGNTFRVGSTTSPAGIPSAPRAAPTASSGRFYSGRGGAGNVHSAEERHALSFAEEYADAAQRERAASHGHVGRGGAGNIFSDDAGKKKKKSRKHSDAASAASAASSGSSSAGSVRSGFWGRLSGASLGHSS